MLSFNTSKGPSLIPSEFYYDIPKPSSFSSLEESEIPSIFLSMRPSGSPSDVPTVNSLEFPSWLSTLMPSHFHLGDPTVPQSTSQQIIVSLNPIKVPP